MNNYNFTQSLDGLNNIEADSINTSNLNVGSLVADNAEITTLSDSNLVNCTTTTIASQDDDLVNKKYVVDNFVDRANNLTQDINGIKTFTTDITVFNAGSPSLFLKTATTANAFSFIRFSGVSLSMNNQNSAGTILFQTNANTRATINSTQLLLSSTTFLTTNDMKSRAPADPHSLLSDITTGTLTISSATATNTINGATQLNQQTTFNNFTPISSVATPTAVNHLTRKDFVDNNFMFKSNNVQESISGYKTFLNRVDLNGGTALVVGTGLASFSGTTTFNAQTTFNNFTPFSNVATPTAVNHLTRKDYCDGTFVDRTNNLAQSINGIKTFSENVICSVVAPTAVNHLTRKDYVDNNFVDRTNNLAQGINGAKTFSENVICSVIAPTANNHLTRKDYVDDNFVDRTNNLAQGINGIKTFSENVICSVASPTAINHLTRKDYVDNNFVDRTNNLAQGINGIKTFSENVICSVASPTAINHLTRKDYADSNFMFKSGAVAESIYGVKTFGSRANFNGTTSIVVAGLAQFNGTSEFNGITTFTSSLKSNNITAPVVLGGTNNIYTNLDASTGGANINIGARNNNINVKCNFNINESGYGTGQNTLIWMEGNNSRFENQNSTGGTYIFTIVESGTFNPLVINKTSVDIAGDAVVSGNLILYDTTPSTLSMSVGVLGNNMTFDPENTEDTTYNFKVNDITGTSTTTPLIISTVSTTVANELISNGQATFNNGATFNSAVDVNGTMTFYDTTNFSTIKQSIKTLLIENPVLSGFIILKTRGATGSVQDTFTFKLLGNTSHVDLICDSALYLKDSTNQTKVQQVNTDLEIQNEVDSGAINFSTTDSSSSLATRASILEDQFYFQVPLTISIGASLYSSFTSGTIGYKTTNTGASQTLTSTTGVNSGQLASLDAGVWKIDYTATITITAPMSILTTLEVFLANSANVDLDIQGLDVINYYNVAVTPTKKIKISASGTLINSGSPATYNLRLIPVYTAGGGNFVGSISATRLS